MGRYLSNSNLLFLYINVNIYINSILFVIEVRHLSKYKLRYYRSKLIQFEFKKISEDNSNPYSSLDAAGQGFLY